MSVFEEYIAFNPLSLLMAGLILLITSLIHRYSQRYMRGDARQTQHQRNILLAGSSMVVMVLSNHLLLFGFFWMLSNILLVRIMRHKGQWQAAASSARLALLTLGIGTVSLWVILALLYNGTGMTQLNGAIEAVTQQNTMLMPMVLLLIVTAICQSALWPAHTWLLSSLNSPTPVSAFMHAGLINGGGYLLVRFSPIMMESPWLMNLLFTLAVASFLIATFWKLIQTDIKRMLACSTMAQMGYMLMQCAVGLFPAAVAHLCWHGLFKANLFLGAGSAINQYQHKHHQASWRHIAIALCVGLAGGILFSLTMGITRQSLSTELLLSLFAGLAIAQLTLTLLRRFSITHALAFSMVATPVAASAYAFSLLLIEHWLQPLALPQPVSLNVLHIAGGTACFAAWLWLNRFDANAPAGERYAKLYMRALNASQPHPATITAIRTHYRFQ